MPQNPRNDLSLRHLVDDAARDIDGMSADALAWRTQALQWRRECQIMARNARAAWPLAVLFCTLWIYNIPWRWIR